MSDPTTVLPAGGQTRDNPSGWTVDTLSSHFNSLIQEMDRRYEQRFVAQEKNTALALTSAEKAVEKAEKAAERRFEAVNEFRGQLADQALTFMPRLESVARHEQSSERIGTLQSRLDRIEGKSTGISSSWAVTIGAVGLVSALIAIGAVFVK